MSLHHVEDCCHYDEFNAVQISLIDLQPHIPNQLITKFKKKLSDPVSIDFSQQFKKSKAIPFDEVVYNVVMCKELNYLITGSSSHVIVHTLTAPYEKLFEIPFSEGIYSLDLEREYSGQLNLVVSTRENELCKLDFSKMIKEKQVEIIWKASRKFQHVWGLKCFKNHVYVIDYASRLYVFDLKTGIDEENVIIDLASSMVDLVFTPEEEMIACGVDRLHILKFNENSSTWEKIKSFNNSQSTINRCFSVWYEKRSRLIYLTDANGKIYIFNRELELLKSVENLSCPYGIVINDRNGEMFVCDTGAEEISITIFK